MKDEEAAAATALKITIDMMLLEQQHYAATGAQNDRTAHSAAKALDQGMGPKDTLRQSRKPHTDGPATLPSEEAVFLRPEGESRAKPQAAARVRKRSRPGEDFGAVKALYP